jgi:hypothetical protein
MKKICYILLFFWAISLGFIIADAPIASAEVEEETGGFENVTLWIYPEYDDPRLLVMLEGDLMGIKAPAQVRFLVPTAAEMYSAGSMDTAGNYTGGPPNRESSSIQGWDEISYEVITDTFRVEYYDPIIKGQPDKTISYNFRWLYPISDLEVIIQEPLRSSNFQVSPEGVLTVDNRGFKTHIYSYGDLDEDTPLHFELSYTKSDPNPSLVVGNSGSTGNGGSPNALLIPSMVIGTIALLSVAALWIIKSRSKPGVARRYADSHIPSRKSKGKRRQGKFCSQCGQNVERSARFCPRCGEKLPKVA